MALCTTRNMGCFHSSPVADVVPLHLTPEQEKDADELVEQCKDLVALEKIHREFEQKELEKLFERVDALKKRQLE